MRSPFFFAVIFTCAIVASLLHAAEPTSSADDSQWVVETKEKARAGDVQAMRELSFHYSVHATDDQQAFYWSVRAADSGNSDEQGVVISRYCSSRTEEDRALGQWFAERWKRIEDCRRETERAICSDACGRSSPEISSTSVVRDCSASRD